MTNLKLRTKLLGIAVAPLLILVVVIAYAGKIVLLDGADVDGASVREDLRVLGVIGLGGIIATGLVIIQVARGVLGPLTKLAESADDLSNRRLPALVEVLRNPAMELPPAGVPLGLDADDELGRLARAIDGLQDVVAEVTATQAELVQRGVTGIVVNLARRNQGLLDRQLELVDGLETSEQDPDRLEGLYRLDHLATRMRRNAESLLVLAGVEPVRRRGGEVALVDVIRVAMGEIEDYRHVELGVLQPVDVAGAVAVDLAHLLSELMENATQFSPPDAPVIVEGGLTPAGTYRLSVVDQGVGMNPQQLADANAVLADPPELSLELSRSLGFLVISRLARRLAVDVQLVPTPGGGVTAVVEVPSDVLAVTGPSVAPAVGAAPSAAVPPGPETPAPLLGLALVLPSTPEPATDRPPAYGPPEPFGAPAPFQAAAPLGEPAPFQAAAPLGEPAPFQAAAPRSATEPSAAPLAGWSPDAASSDALAPFEAPGPIDAPSSIDAPAPLEDPAPSEAPASAAPAADPAFGSWDVEGLPSAPWASPAPVQPPVEHLPAGLSAETPRRLTDALPEGPAFEQGVAALLAPSPPGGPERTDAGLVRRRRGDHAPIAEQPARPAAASGRSPEEIREMLARYRDGIKHRRPIEPPTPPSQEDPR